MRKTHLEKNWGKRADYSGRERGLSPRERAIPNLEEGGRNTEAAKKER